jgi:hypothetical protein
LVLRVITDRFDKLFLCLLIFIEQHNIELVQKYLRFDDSKKQIAVDTVKKNV